MSVVCCYATNIRAVPCVHLESLVTHLRWCASVAYHKLWTQDARKREGLGPQYVLNVSAEAHHGTLLQHHHASWKHRRGDFSGTRRVLVCCSHGLSISCLFPPTSICSEQTSRLFTHISPLVQQCGVSFFRSGASPREVRTTCNGASGKFVYPPKCTSKAGLRLPPSFCAHKLL